jgi:hypothetical protein
VVNDQSALLEGHVATDNVATMSEFHRLEGLHAFLRDLRKSMRALDAGPVPESLIVEAAPNATSVAVFSAVVTCAYSGFPNVYLSAGDGTRVEGHVTVLTGTAEHREPLDEAAPDTLLRATIGREAVDIVWRSTRPCEQVPLDGRVAHQDLEAWLGRACRDVRPCFDGVVLSIDSDVPVLEVVHDLAKLQNWGKKPLDYLPLVGHPAVAGTRSCTTSGR